MQMKKDLSRSSAATQIGWRGISELPPLHIDWSAPSAFYSSQFRQ
jgi:hypothetical protein